MPSLFHPDMLDRLGDFFPSACTIQYPVKTQDPITGEESIIWTDVAGHVDIPCSHGPSGGVEVKLPDQTYVTSNYTLALAGSYPTVTEVMRAVVDSVVYDIILVQPDSHGMKTRILTQKVT